MAAGPMRERLAFDKREDLSTTSPAGDGHGNVEGAWQEQFVCAARLEPLRGGEQIVADRLAGVQGFRVTIRNSIQAALVTTAWRARDARLGTIYNIRAIVTDEKKAYREAICEAGVVT